MPECFQTVLSLGHCEGPRESPLYAVHCEDPWEFPLWTPLFLPLKSREWIKPLNFVLKEGKAKRYSYMHASLSDLRALCCI